MISQHHLSRAGSLLLLAALLVGCNSSAAPENVTPPLQVTISQPIVREVAEYDRTRSLLSKNAATREELETWQAKQLIAQADRLKAKAAVEQAELDLEFTKVTALGSGKIGRTLVDAGNLVNAGGGDTLLTT